LAEDRVRIAEGRPAAAGPEVRAIVLGQIKPKP